MLTNTSNAISFKNNYPLQRFVSTVIIMWNFSHFLLCLRRQLYLEIKEQVHEIDERSKEQVKKKKKCFFVSFLFSYFHAFFELLLFCGEPEGKISEN